MKLTPAFCRWTIAAVAGLALFTVTGFFILPPILKAQLEKRLSAALGRATTVQKVRINPYAMSVTLEGLDIRLKDGTGSFAGWERLYVNFDPLASLTRTWTLGAVELDGFHLTAKREPGGAFTFADILDRLVAPPAAPGARPAQPGRPVRVVALQVRGARLDFVDQQPQRPFATTFGPVSFALEEFVTAGAAGAPYRFEAITEAGERLVWSGTLAADPLESRGAFEIENLVLKKYTPYLDEKIQADVTDGRLSLRGSYEASLAPGRRRLTLTGGALQLHDLKIAERGATEPAVELPSLAIAGIEADAVAMRATVARVELAGGRLAVRREKEGTVNLLTMLRPAASSPAADRAAPAAPLPAFTVGEVALQDFRVELTDLAAPRPARLGLDEIQFSLKNLTLTDGAVMPLRLALRWAPQGTVKVDGQVMLRPEWQADLRTEVAGLEIRPLSPYLETFVNARITQGTVSASGAVRAAPAADAPAVAFDGDVTVEQFGLVDGGYNEELAGFGRLGLAGLKLSTAPQLAVALSEVSVVAPYARVRVHADKTLNLATVARVAPSGAEAPVVPAAVAPRPRITIDRVVVSDGDFRLSDESIEPNVRMAVTRFGGTVAGLSSENLARAEVDLRAAVDGAGPVAITGKLDPLGATKSVDLKLDFKNVDLLPLSPYSGKYAGYELARGQLALDVALQVEDRKLRASNVITLNQFTFGAPVKSPDATKLPVRLGVALLKDVDGRIVIDVPVAGSLDDPSFRVSRVVLRVIVNLLTKAAVSPFALLGSMFGGGGDELAYQEFAPGEAVLQEAELKKLATLVKALNGRPGLSLAIEGGYDGPADTHALKQRKVAALVRGKIWEARHAADPNIAPPDQMEITPEASAAMVKQLFDEKFPPGTEFGAPLAKPPVAAAPPPAPKKSFLGRVAEVVTFRGWRGGEAKPAATAPTEPTPPPTAATGLALEEMTGRLAEAMEVTDNDLRALAAARAQRVRDYFLQEGGIAAERLFLGQGEPKGPRVLLTLQ